MSERYIVTGRLTDARTLSLDVAVPMAAGRVRVVIEALEEQMGRRPYREVMEAIRDRQRQRGHQPPSKEAVDAAIRAERDAWSDELSK